MYYALPGFYVHRNGRTSIYIICECVRNAKFTLKEVKIPNAN